MRRTGLIGVAVAVVSAGLLAGAAPKGSDWPQWRGPNRDGVWPETGIVEKFAGPELKVKWRAKVGNAYSGPTVANGRVFVNDRVTEPTQEERIHCFDAETGKPLWTYAYPCTYAGVSFPNGPRASVTVADGSAYSLGSMGNLICLDAGKGTLQWSHDLNAKYKIRMPDWGIASSPVIEGDSVIVAVSGEGNACLVAFDRKTGKEQWKALADRATYSSPVVITQAGKRVLVYWSAERVVGLDPKNGSVYWESAFPAQNNPIGYIITPVISDNLLYVTAAGEGSLLLRLAKDKTAVEKVWMRRPRGLDRSVLAPTMTTPLLMDGYLYGTDYYGELRCLKAETAEPVWEEKSVMPRARWGTAHLIRNGDRTLIFNERGELILAKLTPKGYTELSRSLLIKPTRGQLNERGGVTWAHPAFAYGHVFARNDEELVCVDLRK